MVADGGGGWLPARAALGRDDDGKKGAPAFRGNKAVLAVPLSRHPGRNGPRERSGPIRDPRRDGGRPLNAHPPEPQLRGYAARVASIHTVIAIIIRFSVSETKPRGTRLPPPTQAHLIERQST